MSQYVTQSVSFSEDGVTLTFMVLPDDVRDGGNLLGSRQINVAYASRQLGEKVRQLQTDVDALAAAASREFEEAPIYDPDDDAEIKGGSHYDDDDEGMGGP